jgi:hypothetical protein
MATYLQKGEKGPIQVWIQDNLYANFHVFVHDLYLSAKLMDRWNVVKRLKLSRNV